MAQSSNNHSFHSLTTSDMKLLTRILSHQPSPVHPYDSSTQSKYRSLTKKDIDKLPVHLRKESGQEKNLCKMHAGLNSGLINSIFEWIHKQVDASVSKCLADPTNTDVLIPDEVMEPFLYLLDIRSMWTPSSSSFFTRRQSKQDKRWAPQKDGCKACMLARLGGEEDIVTPLRASIVAKLSAEDKPKSRRLVWMAALIYGCFTEDVFQRIMDKSESLARSLRMANTEAAFKRAKNAEYWNSTAISPEAGHTKAASRKVKPTDRRREVEHIADVAKEVSPITDEITRVERHTQQEYQDWQAQQRQARWKERRRSVSPIDETGTHLPQTIYQSFSPSKTTAASELYTMPPASHPLLASPFTTPSPPLLRPKTSHTGTPPPFHTPNNSLTMPASSLERPRTSHAAERRRAPPSLPKSSRGSRVPSFLMRRKTSKLSLNNASTATISLLPPPPPSSSPLRIDTPTLPQVPRSSSNASSDTAPSPPPKDMGADLLHRVDYLYHSFHPTQSPPPVPPKRSPPKHTLLPRLNTNMQEPAGQHHLIPIAQPERTSSLYSQGVHLRSSPQLNGQPSPPSVRGSIYDNTEAVRDSRQRSTMRRHYEKQRTSPDSASTTTPTDDSWGKCSNITPLPTPDSAEDYRQLISEQESRFLAPTPPIRYLNSVAAERGMWRSKSSLDSVEEGNEAIAAIEEKKGNVHRKVDSRSKFRPLSPSHMRRQFDPSIGQGSPQSAGGPPNSGSGYTVNTGVEAQEKESGHVRARFRPHVSPNDDGEYQRLIEGQRKEMGLNGRGVERESLDSVQKLYNEL
ncbi:hypothetical protein BLS_001376 [Venturia inaequalis]|uniref:Uncharacterized protein n=1 Tax=Venturia inaequalis TaxID=5025 RepID=A0A8H3Z6C6_VENIN|nr:hypothetical protein BLS_001376 [Venturia inaequalis]